MIFQWSEESSHHLLHSIWAPAKVYSPLISARRLIKVTSGASKASSDHGTFMWCSNDANDANDKSQNIRIENLRSVLLIHLHPVKKVTHSIHWYIITSSYIQDQSSHWHYEQSWAIMATAIWNHLLCGDSMIVPIETMDVSWGIDHTPFTYRGQSTLQPVTKGHHSQLDIDPMNPSPN